MLWRGRHTAIGISPAVGGIMSTAPRPPRKLHWLSGGRRCSKWSGLSGGWAAPVPISSLLWPGERFLCSCHKAGDFPFCRGWWWTHLSAAEVLLPHPTYGRKCMSTSVAACHHHAGIGRDGICTWGFSSREMLDCLLDFFLAGWSVEISVCLNLWQAGNSFGVCWGQH